MLDAALSRGAGRAANVGRRGAVPWQSGKDSCTRWGHRGGLGGDMQSSRSRPSHFQLSLGSASCARGAITVEKQVRPGEFPEEVGVFRRFGVSVCSEGCRQGMLADEAEQRFLGGRERASRPCGGSIRQLRDRFGWRAGLRCGSAPPADSAPAAIRCRKPRSPPLHAGKNIATPPEGESRHSSRRSLCGSAPRSSTRPSRNGHGLRKLAPGGSFSASAGIVDVEQDLASARVTATCRRRRGIKDRRPARPRRADRPGSSARRRQAPRRPRPPS